MMVRKIVMSYLYGLQARIMIECVKIILNPI